MSLASVFYKKAKIYRKQPYNWCVLRLYGLFCNRAMPGGISYKGGDTMYFSSSCEFQVAVHRERFPALWSSPTVSERLLRRQNYTLEIKHLCLSATFCSIDCHASCSWIPGPRVPPPSARVFGITPN